MTDDEHALDVDCDCYKCIGPIYDYTDDGHRYLVNTMERHTLGERCPQCGHLKSHYRDLGRKGRYVCYYCRGPGPEPPDPEYDPPDIPDLDSLDPPDAYKE